MRKRKLLTFLCVAIATSSLWAAYDTEPDENGLYDELYDRPTYFPDFKLTTKYPNNMTYITCARWGRNGDRLTNYEVAVYDQNNELRCIGRSQSTGVSNYRCTLTIPGTEGEHFHFQVLYGDDFQNPTIVDVPQTCEFFTNDVVGHPSDGDPFWFTVPVEPKLLCWTSGFDGDAEKTFSVSEITGAEATDALASACRLHFFGNWENTDISTLTAGNPNLCYVNIDEAPIGMASAFSSSNPNCLFFFNEEMTEAPEGMTNVIAGDKALTDITLYGGTTSNYYPFFCPKNIQLNGHKAEFTRASWSWADGKSGWNTIVLPFDAQLTADGEVLSPYRYTTDIGTRYISTEILGYWLATITCAKNNNVTTESFYKEKTLSANQPYIISLPGERFYTQSGNEVSTKQSISLQDKVIKLVSTSDVIPATPVELRVDPNIEDNLTSFPFTGTYQPLLNQPMYVLKNKAGANGLTAFVYGESASLLPFQAYLNPGQAQQGAKALTIGLAIDDSFMEDETGINEVHDDADPTQGRRYSLSGMSLDKAPVRGIYIQNNKKYLSR